MSAFTIAFTIAMIMIVSPFLIISGLLVLRLIFSFIDEVILPIQEFIKKEGYIISVDGIKDKDTGITSSGNFGMTKLLFKDKTLISVKENIEEIRLNKKCKLFFSRTKAGTERFSRIEYVNCVEDVE